ncbi:MAG: hypothetical protein LBE36_06655 [Flavobacteriaceae bacterium]|jgi:hypothetical protein|nr:hypothetical protein [Flavobacteriaceae bacterium]
MRSNLFLYPDELAPNSVKKSIEYGQQFAAAFWSEWSNKFHSRNRQFGRNRKYALGVQDIDVCKSNIQRKYIKAEYLHIDWNNKLKVLPQMLRNFYNSVDFSNFYPVIRAIDDFAVQIKDTRKNEKLKLFYSKDFIKQMAEINGGQSTIPLDEIPQSKEQIELEEQAAKPLRVERGEEKALQLIALENLFSLTQKEVLKDMVEVNIGISSVSTCPIQGVKLEYIKPEDFIHGQKNNSFFTDCNRFGVIKKISPAMFKNIAKESGIKFNDEEIKKIFGYANSESITESTTVDCLFYTFRTTFTDVYKKKVNRDTKKVSLIDRTEDLGTDKEYKPKHKSDISEPVLDNYDVWFEGAMCLDSENTIIRHRLMKNLPSYQGKIMPPYIVCSPRAVSIVEENIPKIDSLQEVWFRLLHHRNTIRGSITEIDPDAMANIKLGEEVLDPKEILSLYFSMNLAFRRTRDDDGEPINGNRPLTEIPTGIPRAIIELTNQFGNEILMLYQSFGAYQYEQIKSDPKTITDYEPFKLSDNTAMRDYTDMLHLWSVFNYQVASCRLNDAFEWKNIRDKFISHIGADDMSVMEQFRKDRTKHNFQIYIDYIPTKQERADFITWLSRHQESGEIDAVDAYELSNIKNPRQARAELKLRLEANRKRMQDFELQKIQENQNQNIVASNVAYENKAKLLAQEHQQRIELEKTKFEFNSFILQKEGEIKIIESNNSRDTKIQIEQWRQEFQAQQTAFKKQQDAELRKEIQDKSLQGQSQLIKQRKGLIDDVNETEPETFLV